MLEESARRWEKRYLRESWKQGWVEGARDFLLSQIEHRFGPLPKKVRSQIKTIDSPRKLKLLCQRILVAESLEDLEIGELSRKRNPDS